MTTTNVDIKSIVTTSLPEALSSYQITLVDLKFSFIVGLAVFLIFSPLYGSRKSFFDAIAARNVVTFARFFVFAEILLLLILFYFYFEHGSPLKLHQWLGYGNGDSWLYTYGRPTGGLVFISMGMLAEVHPLNRILCIIGCCGQMFGDALSAYQVNDYINQVASNHAPNNNYTRNEMLAYYWRDIVSFGVCTMLLLLVGLLTVILGCCEPQLIHPSLVSGNDLDRYAAMRTLKDRRRIMGIQGMLGEREFPSLHINKKRNSANAALSSSPANTSKKQSDEDQVVEELEDGRLLTTGTANEGAANN